jgi:hypothetical protein
MITNERLEELRRNELLIIQRAFQHPGVRKVSEELAEALGELLTRREVEANPPLAVYRRIDEMPFVPSIFGEILNGEPAKSIDDATFEEKRRGIFSK